MNQTTNLYTMYRESENYYAEYMITPISDPTDIPTDAVWRYSASIANHQVNDLNSQAVSHYLGASMSETTTDTPVVQGNTKYNKTVVGLDGTKTIIDIYRVLSAWSVTNPQLQHLIKKALQAGARGHKDTRQDLVDIKHSIESAILMYDQGESNE